jgi:hypothetical protein
MFFHSVIAVQATASLAQAIIDGAVYKETAASWLMNTALKHVGIIMLRRMH